MRRRPSGFASGHSLLGTTAFRVALATATAFALVALVSFAGLYAVAYQKVLAQIDSDIGRDTRALTAVFEDGGAPALETTIERRLEAGQNGEAFYLLLGPDGRRLAGNLPPLGVPAGLSWVGLPPGSLGLEDGWLRVEGATLPDGNKLVLGRDPQRLADLRELFVSGLLWAELGTFMLGLLFGYLAGRHALRGVQAIALEADRIGAGELHRRIPALGGTAEIARIGAAVNGMLDRIGTLTSSLRQVTDDIAHDLRTPLGRLRQKLERAGRQAHTAEALRAAVEQALVETDAVIATFNALLRIAQIEAQDRRANFADVDLSAVLVRLGDVYGPTAEDAGWRLDTDAVARAVHVDGDADLLAQLVANLIENGLRHTPPGSTIRVALTASAAGIRLGVADDGPGIGREDRARVLNRFVRLDASRGADGTGLGLALVKAVADLHGCTLRLEDAGPGLRVVVDFPA